MSVLHPAGPEEPQTYWVRRALVIGAVVVVLVVIIALVGNAVSSGSAVQANPSPLVPSPVVAASTAASTSADTTAAATASPTASGSASTSASAKPSGKATPSDKATGKSTTTGKATAAPKPTPTKKPAPVACDPDDVRVTLTGKQRLKTKKPNTFSLSLINGSDQTCIGTVTAKNFELKIYSGRDRIWSTDDCSTSVKPIATKLKAQQDVAWTMTWNGRRSRDDCKNRPEIPRAGTYFATAQLKGAKPVQLRMILRG